MFQTAANETCVDMRISNFHVVFFTDDIVIYVPDNRVQNTERIIVSKY